MGKQNEELISLFVITNTLNLFIPLYFLHISYLKPFYIEIDLGYYG